MRDSEVFTEFCKIAQEKGLISEAEAEHTEQNTKSPRWDSLDLSAIEALYGVKPDLPKGMEYERNIMETAHPNSVVISPSYDPLNGLVENEMEAQNIKMHFIFKEPEMGNPNQARYPLKPNMIFPNILGNKVAEKDLLLSLVRIANDMDNKQQDNLRILADACLGQVNQGLKKKAFNPLGFMSSPMVWIPAALLGLTYMNAHLPDVDQGMKVNYSRLMSELEDFRNASVTLGFGHKYDSTLLGEIANMEAQLNEFWSVYDQTVPIIQEIEKVKTPQELMSASKDPKIPGAMQAASSLHDQAKKLQAELKQIVTIFNDPDYKAEHTEEKGPITSLIDSVPFLHGGKTTLTADDFDDVVNAIKPFLDSLNRLVDKMDAASKIQASAATDLAGAQQNAPASTEAPAKTTKDIDEGAGGWWDELKGLTGKVPGFGD